MNFKSKMRKVGKLEFTLAKLEKNYQKEER